MFTEKDDNSEKIYSDVQECDKNHEELAFKSNHGMAHGRPVHWEECQIVFIICIDRVAVNACDDNDDNISIISEPKSILSIMATLTERRFDPKCQ